MKWIKLYLEISFGFIKKLNVKNCECEYMYYNIVHRIDYVNSINSQNCEIYFVL